MRVEWLAPDEKRNPYASARLHRHGAGSLQGDGRSRWIRRGMWSRVIARAPGTTVRFSDQWLCVLRGHALETAQGRWRKRRPSLLTQRLAGIAVLQRPRTGCPDVG